MEHNILNYNIHELLKFRIETTRHALLNDVNLEFAHFMTEEITEADIILNIGSFIPSQQDCHIIDHKYYVRENYLYCRDSAGKANWRVEIFGFEHGATMVNFNGMTLGKESILYPDLLAQDLILKPLIEYKLSKKGYLLIHSGGVSKNGQAYLLAGRGSSFKTTLIMDLVRQGGFSLLGDDQVVLHNGEVLSFPKHIAQFSFKLKYLLTENYSLLDKIRLIKYLWGKSNHTMDVPMVQSSPIRSLCFVVKTNKSTVIKTYVDLESAVKRLVTNNQIDVCVLGRMSGLFLKYMLAYSFVFTNSLIASYWKDLERNLTGVLGKIPIYEIQIPSKYDSNVFGEFWKLVEE